MSYTKSLQSLSQVEAEGIHSSSLPEASLILLAKWYKDITRRGNYRSVFLKNTDL